MFSSISPRSSNETNNVEMKPMYTRSYPSNAQPDFSSFHSNQPEFQATPLERVNSKVDDIKSVLKTNINKAAEREKLLEDLEDHSIDIFESANQFNKKATRVRCMFLKRYLRSISIFILIFLICLLILVVLNYDWLHFL